MKLYASGLIKQYSGWKDHSIKYIEQDIRDRSHNITALQVERDKLNAKFFKDTKNDGILKEIQAINKKIMAAKKPVFERELFLNQGVRVKR